MDKEPSYLARVRKLRQLANLALEAYGLAGARFRLAREAGNTLFRVYAPDPASTRPPDEMFAEDQYLLRIHQPGYQTNEAIELELAWQAAMRRDANLPVPEPVPTLDGRYLGQVSVSGIPEGRNYSLLRWLKGRHLTKGIQSHHYRAQGRLMARLHNFAAQWQPPQALTKRCYDWDGLFRNEVETDQPADASWQWLPELYVEPFEVVAQRARQIMDRWGKGPNVYGLIHSDLGVDANLLFWGGEARAIDFDDSGFGYWVYDLAISLEHCRESMLFPQYRDALLDGYAEMRSLPAEQLQHLELFMAAFFIYWNLWAARFSHFHPKYQEELRKRMERHWRLVVCYLESG